MKYNLRILPFDSLTLKEFHDLVALRIAVFVVEQDCPYQDLDGLDMGAEHLIALDENGVLVATLRILAPGIVYYEHAIGRVVVSVSGRGTGLGHQIMKAAIAHIGGDQGITEAIKLSAQEHLKGYYAAHGFKQCGEGYLEDGIPHIPMLRSAQ